jgi:ankyrin repeat protein
MVKFLLERGANIPAYLISELAMLGRMPEFGGLLIEHFEDFNAKFGDSHGILHIACCHGNYELIKLILSKNCTGINEVNGRGETPLFYATERKYNKICKLLIQHGRIRRL